MNANTNTALVLAVAPCPSDLSDAELLSATRRLVGRSNQLLAALLAHLGEVEARGIHRTCACSSLYAYCIYELRFSEDEAFRRVSAARLVRRFPALLDAVASGELHLTGLLMLGPHLTGANLVEVLLRAKHRTKKEIAPLVRQLDPLPEVPPRIEPLGPALARSVMAAPTWEEFARSLPRSAPDSGRSSSRLAGRRERTRRRGARGVRLFGRRILVGQRDPVRPRHPAGHPDCKRKRGAPRGPTFASAIQGAVHGGRRVREARRGGAGSAFSLGAARGPSRDPASRDARAGR